MSKIAIYAGSFDPITNGHLNLIEKASKMFDKVIVTIGINSKKKYLFTEEERLNLINKCIKKFSNVEVKICNELIANFAEKEKANILIRGARTAEMDFEIAVAHANKQLNNKLETVMLISDLSTQYISSSLVKEIASYNGDISPLVPLEIIQDIKNKYKGEM